MIQTAELLDMYLMKVFEVLAGWVKNSERYQRVIYKSKNFFLLTFGRATLMWLCLELKPSFHSEPSLKLRGFSRINLVT